MHWLWHSVLFSFLKNACYWNKIEIFSPLGCFKPVGIQSSATIADSFLTSSTSRFENEAYKGRLNAASAWSACQLGPCSPKEVVGSKPWIQLCLAKSQLITGLVIQGFGQIEDLAHVSSFTIKYAYTTSGRFYDYKIKSTIKVIRRILWRIKIPEVLIISSLIIDFPYKTIVGKVVLHFSSFTNARKSFTLIFVVILDKSWDWQKDPKQGTM